MSIPKSSQNGQKINLPLGFQRASARVMVNILMSMFRRQLAGAKILTQRTSWKF